MHRLLHQDDSKIRFSFWPDPPSKKYSDDMFPLTDLTIIKPYSLDSMEMPTLDNIPVEEPEDLLSTFTVVDSKDCVSDASIKQKDKGDETGKQENGEQKILDEIGKEKDLDQEGAEEEDGQKENVPIEDVGMVRSIMSAGYNLFHNWISS